jgi:ribonucleoside-triphosphate reductase
MKDFKNEFAEELTPETPEGKTPEASAETKNTGKEGSKPEEHMIPKTRFDEVNSKYKDLQKQLDALTADKTQKKQEQTERERKAKEEQGKFEELYKQTSKDMDGIKAQHKEAKTRVEQLEAVINGLLEARLENVPEEFRDLVPGNLAPEQKLEWLGAAEKKGLFGVASQKKETPVGSQTNPAGGATTDLNTMTPGQLFRMAYGQK